MKKIIRITTVPQSLRGLLKGQLRFISSHYEVIGISSSGEALQEVEANEGIRVHAVEMTRKISPVKDLISVWKLFWFFRKVKPFIVHTHTPKAGTVGMLAAKLAGVPHRLHTVAGLPLLVVTGKKRKLLDSVEKFTYWCATRVYPNSKGLYEFIVKEKFASANKVKVIGKGSSNGIDTNFFNAENISENQKSALRAQLQITEDQFVFVFVGRIVKDKGINELVQAFTRLNSEFPNTKLLLVGRFEPDLDPLFPATVNEIQANNSIVTAGYQSDVRPYFAISNTLVFPSYREGFPNVVMQACAMGINAIVTDINGCNEIIINEQTGFVVPVRDSETLFQKMKYLYHFPEENKKMALMSRGFIKENFESSYVWNEILKEYNSL
ncbi:MAG TPA: glycosyltransferase family 4 protein [Flavobacterium sp.]|jgi:glycosyltransferase involved in cell wall biosynthesis